MWRSFGRFRGSAVGGWSAGEQPAGSAGPGQAACGARWAFTLRAGGAIELGDRLGVLGLELGPKQLPRDARVTLAWRLHHLVHPGLRARLQPRGQRVEDAGRSSAPRALLARARVGVPERGPGGIRAHRLGSQASPSSGAAAGVGSRFGTRCGWRMGRTRCTNDDRAAGAAGEYGRERGDMSAGSVEVARRGGARKPRPPDRSRRARDPRAAWRHDTRSSARAWRARTPGCVEEIGPRLVDAYVPDVAQDGADAPDRSAVRASRRASTPRGSTITGQCASATTRRDTPPSRTARSGP